MKYRIKTTNRFDKQLKRCEKRGYDMHLIFNVMRLLAQNGSLPSKIPPPRIFYPPRLPQRSSGGIRFVAVWRRVADKI